MAELVVDYPLNESVFPPDMVAPRFLWHDPSAADRWTIEFAFEGTAETFRFEAPGDPPPNLIEYLPDDHLCFIDESHMTVPQIRGMYEGDRSRKLQLVRHGFRLPSAMDNRPLTFEEWYERTNLAILLSATPGGWELRESEQVVEQVRDRAAVDDAVAAQEVRYVSDKIFVVLHRGAGSGAQTILQPEHSDQATVQGSEHDRATHRLELGVVLRAEEHLGVEPGLHVDP